MNDTYNMILKLEDERTAMNEAAKVSNLPELPEEFYPFDLYLEDGSIVKIETKEDLEKNLS